MAVRTQYGIQGDAWGALVMDKASLAEGIEQDMIELIESRGLPGLDFYWQEVGLDGIFREGQENLVIKQDLGEGGLATVIFHLAKRGANDLEIAWRLFEKNIRTETFWGLSQGVLTVLGWTLVGIGAFFALAGLVGALFTGGVSLVFDCLSTLFCIPGLMMIFTALGWFAWGRRITSATVPDQFESRALAQTVDWALMRALAHNGVTSAELSVLVEARTQGLGRLEKADLLEPLSRGLDVL